MSSIIYLSCFTLLARDHNLRTLLVNLLGLFFDDEGGEGIYVICTDERSIASLCPIFFGGTKNCGFRLPLKS